MANSGQLFNLLYMQSLKSVYVLSYLETTSLLQRKRVLKIEKESLKEHFSGTAIIAVRKGNSDISQYILLRLFFSPWGNTCSCVQVF